MFKIKVMSLKKVDIKQFWSVDLRSQVGTCTLCANQNKKSTSKPENRKLTSGNLKAYPNWNNMRKHTRTCHPTEYADAQKKLESERGTIGLMDQFIKKRKRDEEEIEDPASKKVAVVLELNAESLKECIRQVCTVDGLPFNTFEKTGMSKIFNPIVQQLRNAQQPISVKSSQVREIVLDGALKLK